MISGAYCWFVPTNQILLKVPKVFMPMIEVDNMLIKLLSPE